MVKQLYIYCILDTSNEEVMNQVDLPILSDSVCQQHFKGFLPNTEICAGYENGHKDWCTVGIYNAYPYFAFDY